MSILSVGLTMLVCGADLAQPSDDAHREHAEPTARVESVPAVREMGKIGAWIAAAEHGQTVVVPAGLYREHVRITKPISLVADGRVVIDGGGRGDIVEITAPDVTLRGFTIRNTGIDLDRENAAVRAVAPRVTIESNTLEDVLFGIDLRESPDSVVRGNVIGGKPLDIARRGDGLRLWRCDRTLVEGNTIHDGRDAILWYSTGVIVRRNVGHDCRYGLHLMFSDDVTIADNQFTRNSVGIYLMYSTGVELTGNRLIRNRGPSGYGIGLKETDRFSVRNNLIVGNRTGVYIDGSPFTDRQPGEFTGNTLAYNDVGMMFLPSARGNELTENNFIDNIDQIAVAGRGSLEANRFWKGDRGNFWSDYTGYDANADGVGDFVHESHTLFENLMDREPSLRLFLFSPAQQAIEFVGRAVPAVRPEPKFVDEVPLMRPVLVACADSAQPAPVVALAASAFGLITLGGAVLALSGALGSAGLRSQPPRPSASGVVAAAEEVDA
ncbi:MAG: nitrous oxide reductase family maturation protein NosD [Phycisphaeraceae bacterium]|nr:nitrous oxide reductase family maturation protein NosD [Phycisphaeraceae bacterium]